MSQIRSMPSMRIRPKQRSIKICEYCKKEKIGGNGKYHKWCSDIVSEIRAKGYSKSSGRK